MNNFYSSFVGSNIRITTNNEKVFIAAESMAAISTKRFSVYDAKAYFISALALALKYESKISYFRVEMQIADNWVLLSAKYNWEV